MLLPALALLQAAEPIDAAAPMAPAIAQQAVANEQELLLYAVELDGLSVTDGLTAYGDPDEPHLPVGELTRLLELPINLNSDGTISGSIGEARRSLLIDVRRNIARVGGRDIPLRAGDAIATQTDVYIRSTVLTALFAVEFEVDAEALIIRLRASERLPLQAKADRISRMRGLDQNLQAGDEVLTVLTPYRLISAPSVDFAFDVGAGSNTESVARRLDIRLAGDLLYTGMQAYIGTDDAGRPATARLTLERRSASGALPLGARRISAGDVFSPGLALGARSASGRGVSLTTVPLDQVSVFNSMDLRGELPIGHDVELYVNDILRSAQRAPVQGRYEFLGVQLARGLNVIRLVSYGPKGERTENTRVLNVGSGQLQRGKTNFEASIVQQDEALLELTRRGRGALALSFTGAPRIAATLAHGLSSNVTVVGGAALFTSVDNKVRQLITAGIRTSIAGAALQADAAADQLGGFAGAIGLAGQAFGIAAVLRHASYSGGFMDETVLGDLRRVRTQNTSLTSDFSVSLGSGLYLPVAARAFREQYADGGSLWSAGVRSSTTVAETLVSQSIDLERESLQQTATTRLTGTTAASRFLHLKWQLRGGLEYDLLPKLQVRAAAITVDRELSEHASLRFGVAQAFQSNETILQAGAVLRTGIGELALTADYTPQRGGWRFGVRVGFGAIFNPRSRRYVLTPPGAAAGSSAIFHSYLDRDGNGEYGPGDQPARGVAVEGGQRRVVTDGSGLAVVTGLGSGSAARVRASIDQTEAFFVGSPPSGIEFEPRPGHVAQIPYPLKPVGEAYIRLTVGSGGGQTGLSAVKVRLVPSQGQPIVGTTEFDGTVIFSQVPLGTYRLELDPEQAERLAMRLGDHSLILVRSDEAAEKDVEVLFRRIGA